MLTLGLPLLLALKLWLPILLPMRDSTAKLFCFQQPQKHNIWKTCATLGLRLFFLSTPGFTNSLCRSSDPSALHHTLAPAASHARISPFLEETVANSSFQRIRVWN
jgi:hypothetical protein